MAAPPVYLDECVDRPVIDGLRQRGFDVLTALEAGRGEDPDDAQLAYATSLGRVLLSYNRTDFRRLHTISVRTERQHSGILLIPQVPPVNRRVVRAALLLDRLARHVGRLSFPPLSVERSPVTAAQRRPPAGVYRERD